MKAHEEVVEFIARGPSTRSVADFRASSEARERVALLIRKEKTDGLTLEEKTELDDFAALESMMNLAKARARQLLAHGH